MAKRVQSRVSGRVQGVGYRYYTAHVAKDLGVVGVVRNTPDGDVEAVVEGEEDALKNFLTAFHRGPHAAEVTDMTAAWSDGTGEFTSFAVIG